MKLYFKFLLMYLKSQMEYKTSFIILFFSQMFFTLTEFVSIYFLFSRFNTVNGFTLQEVLLCFGIVNIASSLAQCFARGFDMFSSIISNGEFDRILLRPKNTIFLTVVSRFDFTKMGRLLQGVVVFIVAVMLSNINFTFDKIIVICLMVICTFILFSCIYVIYSALCFFTTEGLEFLNIFTDGGREFGAYPLSVFGKEILMIFTFIIPLSLVQYYPLLYLLDMNTSFINAVAPIFSLLFIIPTMILWKIGLKKYKSTGS